MIKRPNPGTAMSRGRFVVCATRAGAPPTQVFNVEYLWHRNRLRGGGSHLREALTRHPHTPATRRHKERLFCHVILRLPRQAVVDDERFHGGVQRRELIEDLCALHGQELGDYLPPGLTPRYRVVGDPTLPADQVQFVFGHAIYLPAPQEPLALEIALGPSAGGEAGPADGEADGAPPLPTEGPNRDTPTPGPGLYRHQRLALLGSGLVTWEVPHWPFGERGILVVRGDAGVEVSADPEDSLTIKALDEAHYTVAADGVQWQLTLVSKAMERPDDQWGLGGGAASEGNPQPPGAQAAAAARPTGDGATVVAAGLEGGVAGEAPPRLAVVGFALQRLSVYRRLAGWQDLSHWRFGFDLQGYPTAPERAAVVLTVDADDLLSAEPPLPDGWGEATALLPWQPLGSWSASLVLPPNILAPHYRLLLRLPHPVVMPAVDLDAWLTVGRGDDVDLAPKLLDGAAALEWAPSATAEAADVPCQHPEQLGFARHHFGVCLGAEGWWARAEHPFLPLYALDGDGTAARTITTAVDLHPKAWLVAGSYIFARWS